MQAKDLSSGHHEPHKNPDVAADLCGSCPERPDIRASLWPSVQTTRRNWSILGSLKDPVSKGKMKHN